MADRVRLLFVVADFYQAGTERFTHEVHSAIDRDHFDITFLSALPLNNSERWTDHYYPLHRELGAEIFFLPDVKATPPPPLADKVKRRLGLSDAVNEHPVTAFLKGFDVISVWGEYAYPSISAYLNHHDSPPCLVHIMNSVYQTSGLYDRFDKKSPIRFSSGFTDRQIEDELTGFTGYTHYHFPLSINIPDDSGLWKFKEGTGRKIGIFTRLSRHKALDPFLYAFHLLLEDVPDAELHIFGSGDPEQEGMMHYVRTLRLQGRVHFRGHAEQLRQTAIDEQLDMVWFHAYHGNPGGFAGFDICCTGIPQVFWDFGGKGHKHGSEVLPMYHSLTPFVEYSMKVLTDRQEAEGLSARQFEYVCTHHNIAHHIRSLEQYYLDLIEENARPS